VSVADHPDPDGGCGRSILGQYGTGLEGAGRSIWQE
jgi:hypothetical protein